MPLDKHGFAWLCKVARTSGYRRARSREQPAGAFLPAAGEHDPRALPEPASGVLDPAEGAIDRERSREQRQQLLRLTTRERQFLALQGLGLSYQEIAEREQASLRTVENQILRARRKLRQQP